MRFGENLHVPEVLKIFGYIVALFIVAMFFGAISKKRLGFSAEQKTLKGEILDNEGELETLQHNLMLIKKTHQDCIANRKRNEQSSSEVLSKAKELKKSLLHANESKEILLRNITQSEEAFVAYKKKYRNAVWSSCVGEKHKSITTLSGQTYKDVTITCVTLNGLNITHAQGISVIKHNNLGQEWERRFLWSHGK